MNKNSKSPSLLLPTIMEEITMEATMEIITEIITPNQLLVLVEVDSLFRQLQQLQQAQITQIIQITTQTITLQTKTTIISIIQIIQNQLLLQKEQSPHSKESLQALKQLLQDKKYTISQIELLTTSVQPLYKLIHTMNSLCKTSAILHSKMTLLLS